MEKENDCFLILILIAMSFIFIAFLNDYLSLKEFKKCYENNFHTKQCERFLNY